MPETDTIRILTDSQTRHLYANDASMYEELPQGVCFPASINDIQQLVRRANEEHFSITARSAGTSLAGQATGGGVIMDVSRYMTDILELDTEQKFALLQPGVIRDTLNRKAGRYGLLFGPDTATTSRCMIGGMIGNNSCGSFSIKYGTTRDHIRKIEAVLSDGSRAVFGPMTDEELEKKKKLENLEGYIYRGMTKLIRENREAILEAYPHPDIIRRNTGYALDRLCRMRPFNDDPDAPLFNLAELLCGSEGTLAMTASAEVGLVPADPHKVVLTPHFNSIRDAMEATVEIVKHNPAAVELVDHIILGATKDNIEQSRNRFFLEGEPHCILIIQFEGSDKEELLQKSKGLKESLDSRWSYATPLISDEEQVARVWELRKAGLGLLMGLGADARSPSFCEDTAVRVPDLPDYIEEFQALLKKYDTDCVFYAHASVGELHLRPVIDIQKPEGIQKMKAMAEEIAALVKKYNGSLSGEHGDGRARAPYIEKVLGKGMMPLLQQVKELWDPNYIFNPGKIVRPKNIEDDLRFSPAYRKPEIDTQFEWRKEGGFGDALELCNGAGVCRKLAESGGTMCPSYMATKEEKDSTRGRANLFRQLFSGRQKEAFESDELKDALDLCLSCKACKSECPANVDMARMKAEFMQGWHDRKGLSLDDRFFGRVGTLYPLAGLFPSVTNWLNRTSFGKQLLQSVMNVHPERDLPEFAGQTFRSWFKSHPSDRSKSDPMGKGAPTRQMAKTAIGREIAGRGDRAKVALLVDLFTDYHEPEVGKAAVRLLESVGYEVIVPDISDLGRTRLSKGLVKEAKKKVRLLLPELYGYAQNDIAVIGLEPSEILTLRDEYLDLCKEDQLEMAKAVSKNAYQLEEFLIESAGDRLPAGREKTKVYVHGHCHAKALVGMKPTMKLLRIAGYQPVDLQTGCCGMAGSFGYETKHYEVSMDIGELVLFPSLRKLEEDALVCAPGFSCRHQINDGTGRRAFHPAELLARNL